MIELKILENSIQPRKIIEESHSMLKGLLISSDVKNLQDSIFLHVLICRCEAWKASEGGFVRD